MTFSYLEIVRIMCRCDLYTACSELFIYVRICDNRNLPVCTWKLQSFSNDILIALIIRVYSYGCISEKCLRTCCCDLYESAFLANYRIVDMPEKSFLLLMLYLCVRDRCFTYRTPVYDS